MKNNAILKYVINNHFLATVIIITIAYILFQIKLILIALFAAYIIMASVLPFVKILTRYKIPKIISIVIVYGLSIGFIVLLIVPILPFLVSQIEHFLEKSPTLINLAGEKLGLEINQKDINSSVVPAVGFVGKNILTITSKIFEGFFNILTILILSFYFVLEREKLEKTFVEIFDNKKKDKYLNILNLIEEKLGAWLRGQVVLSLAIGIITWFALTLIGLDFALPLAIFAGFLEIIPTLGPIISAVPAIIVALSVSPLTAGIVILTYIIIQLLENNLLVPKIMQKAVGLNPILVIVSILIGTNLFGIVGALLSIPFLSAIIIIYKNLYK